MFIYLFGAIVFYDVTTEQREAMVARQGAAQILQGGHPIPAGAYRLAAGQVAHSPPPYIDHF